MGAAAVAPVEPELLPDAELVERLRAGERSLFEALMRRYNRRVYRVVRSILRDEAEAEDAMQAAWLTAWRQLAQLSTPAAVGGWIARLAAHEALGRLRRRRPQEPLEELEEERSTMGTPSPEEAAALRELVGRVEAAVDRLPSGEREAFVLRSVEGLETVEAAETLGITPGALKVRLHRARLALRAELGEAIDLAPEAFPFPATRCNPLVARVMARIAEDLTEAPQSRQ